MCLKKIISEGIRVDALIDRLLKEPETIADDYIPYTVPKNAGNSSPSENQSFETQIDHHRLFSE